MAPLTAQASSFAAPQRRLLLLYAAAVVALLLLYRETAVGMVGIWMRSDTFAHAFLVPPITLWLVWRNRDRLQAIDPRPAPIWLLPLALAALGWLLGDLVSVNALTQFALVAMIVLLVPLLFGWPTTRAVLFPLLFLFFCVPVGEFLLPTLMEGTADFTVAALRLSGVPVFREGLQFLIPSGAWSVVEACSGVRYLIASLMVGTLFAYLNYQSLTRRLIFVGVSILVPIIANWLRAYMIVMLGHLSDNRIATGVDHLVYGWVFFGVVITIMFMIGSRWSEPDRPPVQRSQAVATNAPLPTPTLAVVLLGIGALALLPWLAAGAIQQRDMLSSVQLQPVAGQAPWQHEAQAPAWKPIFAGATGELNDAYQRGGSTVALYVAYYRGQDKERKLVSSTNMLVSSSDPVWHPVGVSRKTSMLQNDPVQWRVTHLLGSGRGGASQRLHRTVWQSYWVDDHFEASDVRAKLRAAAGQLLGRGDDGAAVVISADLPPDEGGNALLAEFVAANMGTIRQTLRQAQQGR